MEILGTKKGSRQAGRLRAKPRFSVVIISRNEGQELESTVANVVETLPDEQRELIVVDDGSTDGSTGFLRRMPSVRVVRSEGIGVARSRNLGASHASGDIVVFADAHVRAPAGWAEPIADALRDPAVGAVAPGVYSLTEPRRRGFGLDLVGADLHARWKGKLAQQPYEVAVLPGCFLAMRRSTVRATGGLDPEMRQLGGNDGELTLRLWLLGYRQLVVPQVEVGHLFRTTIPYEATWTAVVHNRLRTALVHFGPERVQRVVQALRVYDRFPAGVAMMLDTNVFARRQAITAQRKFDDDWYFRKFQIEC